MMMQLIRWHALPSIRGWCRYFLANPIPALGLLWIRAVYTLTRRLLGDWTDPHGFTVDSAGTLVCYWTICVERETFHASWGDAIRTAEAPTVIDVGANAGVFTHFVWTLNPLARIVAVEPQQDLVARITAYAQERNATIRTVAAACSDHEGEADLHFDTKGDTGASLSDILVKHSQTVRVPLVTVDGIAPEGPITVLKIDAEGHDLDVLRGSGSTLERTRHVLVEIHKEEDVAAYAELLGPHWDCIRLGKVDYLYSRKRDAGE
jgi:FkbM family methyltransferase